MSIGIVGDSLTYQGGKGTPRILSAFAEAGWDILANDIRIDAVTGRGIRGGIPPVVTWRDQGFLPDVWLIALGTNNLNATPTTLDNAIYDLIDTIRQTTPDATIHWVGVGIRSTEDARVAKVNNALLKRTWPDKFTFCDWDAHIHDGREEAGLWLLSDANGIHMTTAGYAIRNTYLATCIPAAAEGAA